MEWRQIERSVLNMNGMIGVKTGQRQNAMKVTCKHIHIVLYFVVYECMRLRYPKVVCAIEKYEQNRQM